MLLLIFLCILLLILFFGWVYNDHWATNSSYRGSFTSDYRNNADICGAFGKLVAFVLIFYIVIIALHRQQNSWNIVKFEAFKTTLASRQDYSVIERAALFNQVVEWEQTIKLLQHQNRGYLDITIPDKVMGLDLQDMGPTPLGERLEASPLR